VGPQEEELPTPADADSSAAVDPDSASPASTALPPEESPLWLLLTPVLPWLVTLPWGSWALPLVAPLTLYAGFARRVRERRYGAAWSLAMLWAALLSVGVIALVLARPALAARGILHGSAYRAEMFQWITTGTGKESSPERFIPEHVLHLGAFLLLTLASAGYLGLVLGALLMAYMSYFVGSFAAASSQPFVGALAAWVPWSVVRVMAFVLFGALLARPLLVRQAWPFGRREGWLFGLAFAGIAIDILLKVLIAPTWGNLLRDLMAR